jgi:hypothetical protein
MKIIDGIRRRDVEIPDCGRNDLPEFFIEMGFKKGVEIGTYKGEFAEVIAKSGLEIYGVDPWLSYSDYPYYNSREQDQEILNEQYEESKKRLAPYPNAHLIRKTSMEALADFPDESIDFVYIDGNHTFKYVAEDLCEWTKKVKRGGVVCGHDYIYSRPTIAVRHVVDAYVATYAIHKFWVLGRKKVDKGEHRDSWRSWLFIKQ